MESEKPKVPIVGNLPYKSEENIPKKMPRKSDVALYEPPAVRNNKGIFRALPANHSTREKRNNLHQGEEHINHKPSYDYSSHGNINGKNLLF